MFHTSKATGDVSITDSAVQAFGDSRANIGMASVVSQLHPPSKDEGVCYDPFVYYAILVQRERKKVPKIKASMKEFPTIIVIYDTSNL